MWNDQQRLKKIVYVISFSCSYEHFTPISIRGTEIIGSMGHFLAESFSSSLNLFYNQDSYAYTIMPATFPLSIHFYIEFNRRSQMSKLCACVIVKLFVGSNKRHQALLLLSLEEVQTVAFVTLLRWTYCHTRTQRSRCWIAFTVPEEACYALEPAWTWKWIWRFVYSSFSSQMAGGKTFLSFSLFS